MMPTNKNVFIQRRYVPTKHENVFVDFFKTLIKTFLLIRTVKNGGITMKEKWQTFVRDIRKQAGLQVMVIPGIIFMIIFSYMPIYGLRLHLRIIQSLIHYPCQMGRNGEFQDCTEG